MPHKYWEKRENIRAFFDNVKRELGIEHTSQWQETSTRDILKRFGGGALLNRYNNSLAAALADTYGEECTVLDCSSRVSAKFLESTDNQRALLQRVAKRVHINHSNPEEWKGVDRESFRREGGGSLLQRYGSVHNVLLTLRPLTDSEKAWGVHRCRPTILSSFWDSDDNVKDFLTYNSEKLGIRQPEDWLRVSRQDLASIGGSALLKERTLLQALSVAFPNEKWGEMSAGRSAKRSCQRNLRLSVSFLFPELSAQEVLH